jgi:pimeloyl-ACP methyl ester carboxylesterase
MRLHFHVQGEGFPLIILHGLLGFLDNWRLASKRFAERYKVYSLDLRNHGLSPHSDVLNYPVMAQDLREFLDLHSLSSAFVLGHSMGGKVAMQFATTFPDRVAKLAVVDIAPRAYEPYHRPLLNALLALDLTRFRSFGEVDAALSEAIPEITTRQFILKNLKRDKAGRLSWKMNLQGIARNYDVLAMAIAPERDFVKPACFVRAARSNYVTDGDVAAIREMFPQSEICTIPDAGHWLHVDAPEAFFQCITKFLDDS